MGLAKLVPHRYIAWYAIFDGDWLGPLRGFDGPLDYIFYGPLMGEVIDHLILALVLYRQAFGYRRIVLKLGDPNPSKVFWYFVCCLL